MIKCPFLGDYPRKGQADWNSDHVGESMDGREVCWVTPGQSLF